MVDINELNMIIDKYEKFVGLDETVEKLVKNQKFLTTSEVAKKLRISVSSARTFMQREDIPIVKVGKSVRISETALFLYCLERRV